MPKTTRTIPIIPRIPTTSLKKTSPVTAEATGSIIDITEALPASIRERPKVYRRYGKRVFIMEMPMSSTTVFILFAFAIMPGALQNGKSAIKENKKV